MTITKAAPTTGPKRVPRPPTTATVRIVTSTRNSLMLGSTRRLTTEKHMPATAAITAASTNMRSLTRQTLMPFAEAAISSSRIA